MTTTTLSPAVTPHNADAEQGLLASCLIATERVYGVSAEQLHSRARPAWIVEARFVAMEHGYLAGLPIARIATYFHRDAGTVAHALRWCERVLPTEPRMVDRRQRFRALLADSVPAPADPQSATATDLLRELVEGPDEAISDVIARARKFLQLTKTTEDRIPKLKP